MSIYPELSYNDQKVEIQDVRGIQFSILGPQEIRNRSVVEITKTDTYAGSEPIVGGLFDSRMGVLEHNRICCTCEQKNIFCPGHFGHIELAKIINTPVCLDESITSLETARGALDLEACSIINIKPGRVGGYLEAKKIHDLCLSRGVPVWCGGMLETGIGRAANLALAALPGFTLPGDISASARYFSRDITAPFDLDNGHIGVPNSLGIGVEPLPELLASFRKIKTFEVASI